MLLRAALLLAVAATRRAVRACPAGQCSRGDVARLTFLARGLASSGLDLTSRTAPASGRARQRRVGPSQAGDAAGRAGGTVLTDHARRTRASAGG